MPKRGEHIHKRKDGRWEARYKCGISVDGKTLYKSVYAKTYAEVKEKQQKCMAEYRKGAIPERCVPFGSALALWQEVNKSRHKRATNMRYANLFEIRHSVSEDFIVTYAVLVYPATITGVSLHGINDTVFDFLNNTGVVGLSVLRA